MTRLKGSTHLRPYRVWFWVAGNRHEWRRYARTIYEAFDSAREAVSREYPGYQLLNVERIWEMER